LGVASKSQRLTPDDFEKAPVAGVFMVNEVTYYKSQGIIKVTDMTIEILEMEKLEAMRECELLTSLMEWPSMSTGELLE